MSDKTPIRTLNGHPLVDETARQGVAELTEKVAELEETGVGAPGKDGVGIESMRQAVSTSASGGTNTWVATLTNGQQYSFNVRNGQQGEPGKTPVKGVDYWTEADKTELVDEITEEMPVVRYDTYQTLTAQQANMARSNVGIAIGRNVPNASNPAGWSAYVSSYAANAVVCHNGKLYIRQDYWDGELNPEPGTDALSWAEFATGGSTESGDSGILIVTVMRHPDSTLTADKTYEELYAAFGDGRILYANVESEIYPLTYCSVTEVTFGSLRRTGTGIYEYTLSVWSGGYIEEGETQISISHLDFPSAYRGNLIYVNTSGKAYPLRLGTGLKIENGVLMLDGTVTPDTPSKTAICGTFLAGQVLCGEGI